MSAEREEHTSGPVIRDRRRIDPETGEVREQPAAAAPAPGPDGAGTGAAGSPAASELESAVAERTADLQRLQAEFLNYKRRVERERENARKTAVVSTLSALLPVLDDIERAREHGELTGGFRAVAESLERTVASLGMSSYGAPGDPFDPRVHEALMHSYSDDVTEPVCSAILQVGYRIDDRIVRPARVAVAEPPASVDSVASESESPDAGAAQEAVGAETSDATGDGGSQGDFTSYGDTGTEAQDESDGRAATPA